MTMAEETRFVITIRVLALVGCCSMMIITLPYFMCLAWKPASKRKRLTMVMTLMPLVFGLTALISTFVPRFMVYAMLLQHVAEAFTLHSLSKLIITVLGGRDAALELLKAKEPRRWLATLPLCCCCRCLPIQVFDEKLLFILRLLTRQFLVFVPTLSLIYIVVSYSTQYVVPERVVQTLLLLSALGALWGLFVLYRATHNETKHGRITLKFVAIKLVIIIGIVQESFFNYISRSDLFQHNPHYAAQDLANIVSSALLCIESPVLTLIVLCAFPPRELNHPEALDGGGALTSLLISASPGGDKDEVPVASTSAYI